MDVSALLENTPLRKLVRNYIRDPSAVLYISILVEILMMSFLAVVSSQTYRRLTALCARLNSINLRASYAGQLFHVCLL